MSRAAIRWFCVGGAVRDRLLGRQTADRDFVVVGATPEQLERAGFRAVGRDFPVFLHPLTGEECALARTERKQGRGYRGFTVHAAPDVTLEDDLARRDLTINALAQPVRNDPLTAAPEVDWNAPVVDPFGGLDDLAARRLRHVSPAFVEDPVRLLRLARFAAQLAQGPTRLDDSHGPAPNTADAGRAALAALAREPHEGGFHVASETLELARQMVRTGELDHLVAERVWTEFDKALQAPDPVRFFAVLDATGALAVVLPELTALFGVPQPPRYHPEIDTGVHTLLVLAAASAASTDPIVRFAALTHDLGKADTPKTRWPSHPGHEQASVTRIDALCARLRIPNGYRDLARLVAAHHGRVHRLRELPPDAIVNFLDALDLGRRPERLEPFLAAVEADYRGRTGFQHHAYPQADLLRRLAACWLNIRPDAELLAQHQGAAIAKALRQRRVDAVAQIVNQIENQAVAEDRGAGTNAK